MVREAEKHAAADKEQKERIEAVNQAETMLHDTEAKIEEFKDQLPAEDIEKIKTQIGEVRQKLADKDRRAFELWLWGFGQTLAAQKWLLTGGFRA